MLRVVVDANVFISGTICPKGSSAEILNSWRAGHFELVTCAAIISEVDEKLRLPRIRNKYSLRDEEVTDLVQQLWLASQLVPGTAPVNPLPPDSDDTMLLSAAIEAVAEYIVTGDKPLQSFPWRSSTRIVSPREFCESLAKHIAKQAP